MFRNKLLLSLALTVPVVLLSTDIQAWFGYAIPEFPGSRYAAAILGTVVFVYGGLVFVRGARGELADRQPGMMTLISLAIVVAFVTSWAGTLGLFEVEIWWELATLITIMLLGHWLEMRSIEQARGALAALAELLPDTAERPHPTSPFAAKPRRERKKQKQKATTRRRASPRDPKTKRNRRHPPTRPPAVQPRRAHGA
jgi:Cu2+-exporting ATPase